MMSFYAFRGNSMWGTRMRGLFCWNLNGWSETNRNGMSGKLIFSFGWKEKIEFHANLR